MNSKLLPQLKKPLHQQLLDKSAQLTLHRAKLGKKGEDYAVQYLLSKGYKILDRNFKATYGELDIICLSPNVIPVKNVILSEAKNPVRVQAGASISRNILVFIEVKTRIGRNFGLPEESVTPRKLREIIKTSQYYVLKTPNLPEQQRIDVIAIEYGEGEKIVYFNHIENVTL